MSNFRTLASDFSSVSFLGRNLWQGLLYGKVYRSIVKKNQSRHKEKDLPLDG